MHYARCKSLFIQSSTPTSKHPVIQAQGTIRVKGIMYGEGGITDVFPVVYGSVFTEADFLRTRFGRHCFRPVHIKQ